jgi:DNA-binding MarR family transcriptional regulator
MHRAGEVVANGDVELARGSPVERLGRAWRELRRGTATGVLVEQLFGRHGEPSSVEPGHLDVLDILSARDGQRMSELALALRVDPSTVTRTMHRMETAGLARRAAFERDGRVVTAHLTEEGRRVHALVAAKRTALIEAALEDFTPDERLELVELLERFLHALDRNTTGRVDPAR